MTGASILLLCWVYKPDPRDPTMLTFDTYLQQPGPICEVQRTLLDAAVKHHETPNAGYKLYEIVLTDKGATIKERTIPALRIE